jgi:hypothetical protein
MPGCPIKSKWKRLARARVSEAQGVLHSWSGVGGHDGVVVAAMRATFSLERPVFQDRSLGVE